MAKNLELNIVLGAAVASAISGMSQVANALKNTTKSVKEFEKEIKSMEKAQKAFQNMDKARDGLNKINSEYKKAAEHLQKLKAEYERTGSSNKQLAKEIEQAEKNVGKLNKQKERQQHVFEAARSKIEAEGASLSNYRNKVQEVEKEIEKLNKLKEAQKRYDSRQESIGRMKDFGDKQITQGMGVAGALAIPVKIALDTQESQADLKKMVNGAEKYYGKLRNISERSALSQAKVFEMAGALAQSGIQEKDLVEYTEQANKIAVAFDIDAAAAGNFLAKTKEQLGLGKEELFAYSNAINHMSDNSASRAAELTEISGRVGGIAKGAGVSKSALLGLSATLVSFNKTPEQAATGLKNFFGALTKGSATSKKATNAFKSIGLDVNKLAADMQRDGEGTILRVLQKIKESDPTQQGALISTIFGEEAKSSVQDMVNNLDKVKANLKEAKKGFGTDAVNVEYKNRMNTPLNKMLEAKNKVVNSMGDLGNALMPTITGALEKLSPLIEKVSQFIQKNPQLAAGIMKAVAGFAAFKIGLGGLAKGFAPVFSGISKGIHIFDKFKAAGSFAEGFKTAFPTISKVGSMFKKVGLAIKAAFMANPVILIIAAIVAVIAIVVVLYNKCAWFRNGVNAIFKAVANFIKQVWQGIKPTVMNVITGIKNIVKQGVDFIKLVWKIIKPTVMEVWNAIKAAAIALWNGLKSGITAVGSFFKSTWEGIKGAAIGVWNAIKSAFDSVASALKGAIDGVVNYFKGKWESLKSMVSSGLGAVGGLLGIGKNATGTNYWSGGLTTVAERGAELIQIPGKPAFLAEHEMLLNLPRGTQILNNRETRNSFRDKISGLKERMSGLGNNEGSSGGDTINISITVNGNADTNAIEKAVMRALAKAKNKKERTAFG